MKNCNCKKKYEYSGYEKLDTDYKSYVKILWDDGTTTQARVQKDDKFKIRYGILLATLKKFAPNISIDFIENVIDSSQLSYKQRLEFKTFIFLEIVKATAGKKCVNDIVNQDFSEPKSSNNRNLIKALLLLALEDYINKM